MEATILCDLSDPHQMLGTSKPFTNSRFEDCAFDLAQARSRGHLVSHIISKWPGYRRLLPNCTAHADEPVFLATNGTINDFDVFVDYLLGFPVQRITLIGIASPYFEQELEKQFSAFDTDIQSRILDIPRPEKMSRIVDQTKKLECRKIL